MMQVCFVEAANCLPLLHWNPKTILAKVNGRMIFFSVLVVKKLDYVTKNCAGEKKRSFLSTRYNYISVSLLPEVDLLLITFKKAFY